MKIKVKLLNVASVFQYEGENYYPGDVFMVAPENFVGYLMTKVLEKPKTEQVKESEVTIVKDEGVVSEPADVKDLTISTKPKPRKRTGNA